MSKLAKIALIGAGAVAGFFVVTFTVYIFNLDMKLLSKIEPLFIKHYDTMPRNQSL